MRLSTLIANSWRRTDPAHAATLLGPRTKGRTTQRALITENGTSALSDRAPIRTYALRNGGGLVREFLATELDGRTDQLSYEEAEARGMEVHTLDDELVTLSRTGPVVTWLVSVHTTLDGALVAWMPGEVLAPLDTRVGPQSDTRVRVMPAQFHECEMCTDLVDGPDPLCPSCDRA